MPYRPRAPVRRRKYAKRARRPLRMRRPRVKRAPSSGGTFVVRKVQELLSSVPSAISPGNYTINTANNSITFGTPVAVPGIALNTYDVPFTIRFRLDELTQYGELTQLFDRYKITSCMVKCHYLNFPADSRIVLPYIDYIQDYDDANVLTISQMREKMGVRTKAFTTSKPVITMGVKPRVASEVFNNGITTAYSVPRGGTWINSQYPSVEHYAIKGILRNVYLPATSGASLISWDISYGVALKDVQ